MPTLTEGQATPSATDGDGVRVVALGKSRLAPMVWIAAGCIVAAIIAASLLWPRPPAASVARQVADAGGPVAAPAPADPVESVPMPATTPATTTPQPAAEEPQPSRVPWASPDPNDLANYIPPGTPEPTVTEVIEALHAAGDKGGIGAFNPPGTSPPLRGLAVPADFVLPPGYVRHHQVSDSGEPIEPILMFSPDYVFRDAAGNPVPIPENRVVPPEMAPPGLPIRPVEIPPPQ